MRFALFCQSIISDWNHGNAHFLRGLVRALQRRGHAVACYEQRDNWSLSHLLAERPDAIAEFAVRFPDIHFERYALDAELDARLAAALEGCDAAIVNEWVEPAVIRLVARLCRQFDVRSVFHDSHYRVVLDASWRAKLDLPAYDAILAFSPSLARRYRELGFRNVHVLHEAADLTVFYPRDVPRRDDVVFIGNYTEGDRDEEMEAYFFGPRRMLPELRFALYGVRYPAEIRERMAGDWCIDYRGRIANADTPAVYSASKVALHIPRRQYVEQLPGTPTIRVFEALASGVCLVSLPWPDEDRLFDAGEDYVVASSPTELRDAVSWLSRDDAARRRIAAHGLATVRARHTCDHRAAQLLEVLRCA